jgi:hypothetical protein
MLFIFSTPVLIRHLWQLKTVVYVQCCLMRAVLFQDTEHFLCRVSTINDHKKFTSTVANTDIVQSLRNALVPVLSKYYNRK